MIIWLNYRLWAKRHADAINAWIHAWAPSGLTVARTASSAADTAGHVQTQIGLARDGTQAPSYVLSLDLEKCFDRYHLAAIRYVAQQHGLASVLGALSVYSRLSRLVFVDNEPSDYLLSGSGIFEIPQGCPLAYPI